MAKPAISEFKDDKHRKQAEEFLLAMGRFIVAFERVCEAMRYGIMFSLRSQGLRNDGMEQVIIGDTSSAQLQVLLGALYSHLPNQDKEDDQAVRTLLKEIKELTEQRNVVVHTSWRLGKPPSGVTLYAAAMRPRTKQNFGAIPEFRGLSASHLKQLSARSKAAQVKLNRLTACITQPSFKVSTELSKPT